MRYIDLATNQLIYTGKQATPGFWDLHWNVDSGIEDKILYIKSTFVSRITRMYLKPEDGVILEGGCGTAQHVAALANNGYTCIGIDYAVETVNNLNLFIPELDVRLGDVRKLEFPDNFFSGYWSLGVIEHFYEGYKPIALEMRRVLRQHGYLFLRFPCMSLLRKIKARLNLFEPWLHDQPPGNFYQFALNVPLVVHNFEKLGFLLLKSIHFDSTTGTAQEIPIMEKCVGFPYRKSNPNIVIRVVRGIFRRIMLPIANHSILLIFTKT